MTEFGNAERMLDHYGDGLMYVPEIDGWFMWTGNYWRRAAGVELEHLAKETVRALPDEGKNIEADGERAEFYKFCAVSQRAIMVRNMVSLAQSDPRVVVGVAELDHPVRYGYALTAGEEELVRAMREQRLTGIQHGVIQTPAGRDAIKRIHALQPDALDPRALELIRAHSPGVIQ